MNVQPGDLARVVAPYHPNGRGAFVEVVRQAASVETLCGVTYYNKNNYSCVGWVVVGWVRGSTNEAHGPELVINDSCLRRVDPGNGVDEVLALVGKPEGVPA